MKLSTKLLIFLGLLLVVLGIVALAYWWISAASRLSDGVHEGLILSCTLEEDLSVEEPNSEQSEDANESYRCLAIKPANRREYPLNLDQEIAFIANVAVWACQAQGKILLSEVSINSKGFDSVNPDTFRCIEESRMSIPKQ